MTRKQKTITLVLILLLSALLVPGAARAQEPVTVANMTIRVWPEFDDPSVLLILEGQASLPGPVDLIIPLPADSRVNAVAYADDIGNLLTVEYTESAGVLTVQSPNGSFWIEIYDPALTVDGDNRSYDLNWTPTFNITNLGIEVQTPFGARGMAVLPEGVSGGTDQFGLPITVISQQTVAAGDGVSLSFTYTKTDPTLSADWIGQTLPSEVAPAAPETPLVAASSGPSTLVIVLLIVGGLALVGGGVWYVVQASRKPSPRSARRSIPAARGGGQRFCTQCGQPIEPGDQFCRHCGAKQ